MRPLPQLTPGVTFCRNPGGGAFSEIREKCPYSASRTPLLIDLAFDLLSDEM
jgi:hypothetical protein